MAVNLDVTIKNAGLNKAFRSTGPMNIIKIAWYSTSTGHEGDTEDIEFNAPSGGQLTLKNPVSLAVPQYEIVNMLRLYSGDSTILSNIHLENKEGEPEEIGDFTDNAGTYQINSFFIRFPFE